MFQMEGKKWPEKEKASQAYRFHGSVLVVCPLQKESCQGK
jgi:hypothetical protein